MVLDDEDVVARLQPLVDAYPGAQMNVSLQLSAKGLWPRYGKSFCP
ncbi:MAG: hypothetical protein F6K26_42805 [Moorea sp. SIO2I5]|nr:hypothetical protein [Moorena sp. SIO2I5]